MQESFMSQSLQPFLEWFLKIILTFLTVQFSSFKYIYSVVQPISRMFSSCKTVTLHPSNNSSHFSSFPTSGSQYSSFCSYEFDYFTYLM